MAFMAINILFNLIAPFYDRVIKPPELEEIRQLLNLPMDGWMLEAGGGTGRVSSALRPWVDKFVVCDLSRPMLQEAQTKESLLLVQTRSERLPFPDESFERILVVDALHHFSDQAGAIRDLLRILKPGGRLLVEEPDISHWQVKMIALFEKLALMNSHIHEATEISQMIQACGLPAQIKRNNGFSVWVMGDKQEHGSEPISPAPDSEEGNLI